jgi:hypothetical protein
LSLKGTLTFFNSLDEILTQLAVWGPEKLRMRR